MKDETFEFTGEVWLYPGATPWHFVTLPSDLAAQIRFFQPQRNGFGSVKVEVVIGDTCWQTSIFPDKKSASFLLPLKADVRKKEKITNGQSVNVCLRIKTA